MSANRRLVDEPPPGVATATVLDLADRPDRYPPRQMSDTPTADRLRRQLAVWTAILGVAGIGLIVVG